MSPEWISVEDRLPEDTNEYLVWRGFLVVAQLFVAADQRFVSQVDGKPFLGVTHWMPFPAPPEVSK